MKTKRIPICLPSTLLAEIDSLAAKSSTTRAAIVSSMLTAAVAKPENVIPFAPRS
jgi:metal-responsive CopG/Arc/MetJ family transcriptional regulator